MDIAWDTIPGDTYDDHSGYRLWSSDLHVDDSIENATFTDVFAYSGRLVPVEDATQVMNISDIALIGPVVDESIFDLMSIIETITTQVNIWDSDDIPVLANTFGIWIPEAPFIGNPGD